MLDYNLRGPAGLQIVSFHDLRAVFVRSGSARHTPHAATPLTLFDSFFAFLN